MCFSSLSVSLSLYVVGRSVVRSDWLRVYRVARPAIVDYKHFVCIERKKKKQCFQFICFGVLFDGYCVRLRSLCNFDFLFPFLFCGCNAREQKFNKAPIIIINWRVSPLRCGTNIAVIYRNISNQRNWDKLPLFFGERYWLVSWLGSLSICFPNWMSL